MATVLERFLSKIQFCPVTGCWIWTAAIRGNGYGAFRTEGQSLEYAHRFSYMHYKGPIVDNLFVVHTCNIKLCVNPDHLKLGTHAENMQDVSRSAVLKGEKHPRAVLTELQVHRIHDLKSEGRSTVSIATEFGVSSAAVQAILKGKSWRHIFQPQLA